MPAAVISAKATAASAGGVTGSLGLLVLSECGIPMPIPADVLMLLVGERAAAGVLPLWLAALAFALIAAVGTGRPCWPALVPASGSVRSGSSG